ncbi:hypothetical protein PLICRDRAFT_439093 [Plicaturopsis crispa FD-325 SS-3]|uniref:Oxidation resistance protein 1 n=1 Tax=Plicaturopsis crispa FD-325 SS-3 TaxID=944288 RepID=A0A0C9SKH0_PLICR|nr:hypothetical protein PLICRDRAFT_439093 [Plicaturopsis crispa FD-325 SS-3]
MHPVRQGNNAERTGGEDLLLDLRPATPPPRSPSVPASPPRDDPTDMARPSLPRSTTSPPPLSSSNSYGSIGTLSSRFMSTLLSTSRAAPASTSPDAHRARDTQFTHEHGASEPLRTHSQSHMPIHAQTLPASSAPSTFLQSSAISHGTPFGAPLPVQASGAPGFSIAQDRAWDKKGFSDDFDREKVERRSLTLAGRGAATTAVLSTTLADLIRPYCPALARLPRTWSLLYSLDQHGISLKTLYTRCSLDFRAQQKGKGTALVGEAGMLLVVRDAGDAVFGAFVGDGIRCEKGYYGSGESFLWKYVDGKLRVFKWTGRNDYVALCEPDYISFGGGDGHYGLYLDDTLYDGSSARCPTFDNEPLGSGVGKTFECVGLEVWGIGP